MASARRLFRSLDAHPQPVWGKDCKDCGENDVHDGEKAWRGIRGGVLQKVAHQVAVD